MTIEDAKKYVLSQEPTFLQRAKNIAGKHSFCCPFDGCNNGCGKDGTGIMLVPRTYSHPKYHCFVCGESGDVFDLAKAYFHLSTPSEVFRTVYEYYGVEIDPPEGKDNSDNDDKPKNRELSPELMKKINEAKQNSVKFPVKEETSYNYQNKVKYFHLVQTNLDPSYLEGRGLSLETQVHFGVGTDLHWKNPRTVDQYKEMGWPISQIKTTPRCIIPTSVTSYLARDIRKDIPDNEKRFCKMKYGTVPLFNLDRSKQEDIVFVTEGEIDAMSIYEVSKKEATGLGSTSNWRQFVNKVKEDPNHGNKVFVLMLDNDGPGQKTQGLVKDALESFGCSVLTPPLGDYNDPSAYLEGDRKNFERIVNESIVIAKTYLPQRDDRESDFDMQM